MLEPLVNERYLCIAKHHFNLQSNKAAKFNWVKIFCINSMISWGAWDFHPNSILLNFTIISIFFLKLDFDIQNCSLALEKNKQNEAFQVYSLLYFKTSKK